MAAVFIRPMRPEDLDQVAAIEAENFSRPWTRQDYAAFLARADALFLVAAEQTAAPIGEETGSSAAQGRVLGYIGAYGLAPEGDITNVSVQRAAQGQGLGGLLVRALQQAAAARGLTTIFLEVRESNAPARALYARAGFVPVGLRKNYYAAPREHAVMMRWDAPPRS